MKLTPAGQKLLGSLKVPAIIVAAIVLLFLAYQQGMFARFGIKPKQSTVVSTVELKDSGFNKTATGVAKVALPSTKATTKPGQTFVVGIIPWNANMGQMFANGGAFTTSGSLMEQYGVKVRFVRQDKPNLMQDEQVAFVDALSKGEKFPSTGMAFVQLMGDGVPAYLIELQRRLASYGPKFRARVYGSGGRSYGEDALWGPDEWLTNPQSMKGAVIAGVIGDGDWCIAMSFLSKNGVKNNPDVTTYDPDAVNWVATDSSSDAVRKTIDGFSEERPVVRDGKRTSEKQRITVQGFVGWTPDDVTYAREKGGLTRIFSTAPGENSEEMPMIIIGIEQFVQANPKLMKGYLRATFEGSDQVRSHPEALQFASAVSDKVYAEKNTGPAYWAKYYQGVIEQDATGAKVPLGGSAVHNLGDNLKLFGIEGGSVNPVSPYAAVYNGFGAIVLQQFLTKEKSFPKYSDVFDPRFLIELEREMPQSASEAAIVTDYSGGEAGRRVGNRSWQIEFNSGSSAITPAGQKVVRDLANELLSGSSKIDLIGHTDNTGVSDRGMRERQNQNLSEARAKAVQAALQSLNRSAFPQDRFRSVEGRGEREPIADNGSAAGKAKNRRVQVELYTGQ